MDMRSGNALSHKRLLVIDDSRTFCSLLRSIMRDIGVRDITDIVDPNLALEFLEANPVDCITVDYMMPGMDGLDLIRRLRTSPTSVNRHAPIMLITGHADARLIQNAIRAGVDEILVKPLRPSTFTERLSRTLTAPRRDTGSERWRSAPSGEKGEKQGKSEDRAAADRASPVVPLEKPGPKNMPDSYELAEPAHEVFLID